MLPLLVLALVATFLIGLGLGVELCHLLEK